MNRTKRLGLYQPQVSDDVLNTINWLADNFQTLDDNFDETISNIDSFLTIGETYEVGKKYWNRSAYLGGFIGWVNTRTGVYAPTWKSQTTYVAGDKVTAFYDNGHYFECVVGGTSAVNHPAFSTAVAGEITYDLNGHTKWTASYVYDLNDIVIKTNGDMTYYYKCIIAGTSGTTEPAWNDIEGATLIDGSVHWYVYKTIQWKERGTSCFFTPFGNIGIDPNYEGQDSIKTVGTITTGTWQGSAVSVTYGGTGANNAQQARINLGATTKFAQTIGDGTTTSFIINHNLGTQDVVVMIREADSPFSSKVEADIQISDSNSIMVDFATAPSANQYRVVIVG